jgi:hypothetical protein
MATAKKACELCVAARIAGSPKFWDFPVMPKEKMDALPASIEGVLRKGDVVYGRVQSHVGVVRYFLLRIPRGKRRGKARDLEICARGVIPGFCPLREPVRQMRVGNCLEVESGWRPEPKEDNHILAPWDTVEGKEEESISEAVGALDHHGWTPIRVTGGADYSPELRGRAGPRSASIVVEGEPGLPGLPQSSPDVGIPIDEDTPVKGMRSDGSDSSIAKAAEEKDRRCARSEVPGDGGLVGGVRSGHSGNPLKKGRRRPFTLPLS